MLRLDKIFFDAITANSELMQVVGGRVKSTCFEVAPDEQDNTPLPYITILDEGKRPAQTTKDDDEWLPSMWTVGAGIEVGGTSPNKVDDIMEKVIKVIADYMKTFDDGDIYLNEGFPQTQGVAWDWLKPCYYDVVHYQCDIINKNDDE